MNENMEGSAPFAKISVESKENGKELDVLKLADEVLEKAEIETAEAVSESREVRNSAAGAKIEKELTAAMQDLFDFEDRAIESFNKLKSRITDIVFGGQENNSENSRLPKEIFVPEEGIERISKTGSRGRREALSEWKEKYAEQKETLASFQEEMIGRIRQNPDMHLDNFRFIKERTNELGLTPLQKETILSIFNSYAEKHNEVAAVRKENPDDSELFEELFKAKPKGKIEIVEGPMTLYFRCYELEDYAVIHSQSFLSGNKVSEHDIKSANMSQGCSISTAPIKGLEGCIIAENRFLMNKSFQAVEGFPKVYSSARNEWIDKEAAKEDIDAESEKTRIHEEQHAIKQLFSETLLRRNTFTELLAAKTEKDQEIWLSNYLRYVRQIIAEPRVKDEILAFFKEDSSPKDTYKNLVRSKKEGGLYDYLEVDESRMPSTFHYLLKLESFKKLYSDTRDKIFREEYHALIENSIRNTVFLKKNGYTKEQVIGLLINEPLSKWAKVIGRLVEGKRIATEKKKG